MFNESSSPTVANCTFVDNAADLGGAIHNYSSSLSVVHSVFTSNSAVDGGGIYNSGNSSGAVTGCTFASNLAASDGGGMASFDSALHVVDSTFTGNEAINGGGMSNVGSPMTVTDSVFFNNTAENGGGMMNTGSEATIKRCAFYRNSAIRGGGLENNYSDALIDSCSFSENTAWWIGGGMSVWAGAPTIVNSVFWGNRSEGEGGGMCTWEVGTPSVTNCSFYRNSANHVGGAMCSRQPTVTNSILWEDSPDEIAYDELGTGQVTYSNVQSGYPGEGNIDADPFFADPENGDFHLVGASPCIDTGLNGAPGLPATDYEGQSRVIDGDADGTPMVDMGADEAVEPVAITSPEIRSDAPTDLGQATMLTGTVSSGNNVRWEWDFGDEETGLGQVVTHTYGAEGVYSVLLTASNMMGEVSAGTTVTVTAPVFHVYLPVVMRNAGPPPAPVLYPIDNADGDHAYTVAWSTVTGGDEYQLEEARDPAFSDAVSVYNGSGTTKSVTVGEVGRYYYRVMATNDWGGSGWSNFQSVEVSHVPAGILPQPGVWDCFAGVGNTVRFTVSGDSNSASNGYIRSSCGSLTIPGPEPIVDSSFGLLDPAGDGHISVTFESATEGSGGWSHIKGSCVSFGTMHCSP
jgi:hypothetical protein